MPARLTAEDYGRSAIERIGAASTMYHQRRFVEALYFAGVAVECTLAIYATRVGYRVADAEHNLWKLMKAATLERFIGQRRQREMTEALLKVGIRWHNLFRYYPASRLLTEMKRRKLYVRIRGDVLKENARITLDAALTIVNKGVVEAWTSKRR